MNGKVIYEQYPHYYDLIHKRYGYRMHSEALTQSLFAYGIRKGARLFEAACGTGNYLACFDADFSVSGCDLSAPMLALARQKLPHVHLLKADLQTLRLDDRVDVMLCLCSSIAYMADVGALHQACRSFAEALKPGGIVLLRPWLTPHEATCPRLWMDHYDGPDLKLCRQAVHRREDDASLLDFHWSVASVHGGVQHFVDRHRLSLFTDEDIGSALQGAGLVNIGRVAVPGMATQLWMARCPS